MNLLALIPEKYKPTVDLVVGQVPYLKCVLDGHTPIPLIRTVAKNNDGVKQMRLCLRCHLAYWEEPS